MSDEILTKTASVLELDEDRAIAELASALHLPDLGSVILFISPKYNPEKLSAAINHHFSCHVIGCTTAGEVSPYYVDGITAISLSATAYKLHTVLIDLSKEIDSNVFNAFTEIENKESIFGKNTVGKTSVGYLLIDGLSMKEEDTAAAIHNALPQLPLLGGSAGDGLDFKETRIFAEGEFHTNAAIFTFIETSLDFEVFKLQHFKPSNTELIVTEANTTNRIVSELDGEPAAEYFASILNLNVDELTPEIFSINPLMLQIGNEWYVRSIQKVNDDGSLQFYCAIDVGLPLTIGKGVEIEINLRKSVDRLSHKFKSIDLTIGCDCILRRLEILNKQKEADISKILQEINFCGFSTYGEQFNSLHINQTLTGVIFGKKKHG